VLSLSKHCPSWLRKKGQHLACAALLVDKLNANGRVL